MLWQGERAQRSLVVPRLEREDALQQRYGEAVKHDTLKTSGAPRLVVQLGFVTC